MTDHAPASGDEITRKRPSHDAEADDTDHILHGLHSFVRNRSPEFKIVALSRRRGIKGSPNVVDVFREPAEHVDLSSATRQPTLPSIPRRRSNVPTRALTSQLAIANDQCFDCCLARSSSGGQSPPDR